jgi:hypothetical protein
MPPTTRPRTTAQVLKQQAEDTERNRPKPAAAAPAGTPTPPAPTAVALASSTALVAPDTRSDHARYLDAIAPTGIVGRLIKWSKEGEFATNDDGAVIGDDRDFAALCDQVQVGYIKFNDEAPPDRHMGLLYAGFRMPPREELGDTDPGQWPQGLSGAPTDPWQHMVNLVLQETSTGALYTFSTTSKTGRRAVGNLLRHYDRMQQTHPDMYPVVRLKKSGFQHRDERIGWVATPAFAVVGRMPKDSAAKPDTSPAGDLDDEIPFS